MCKDRSLACYEIPRPAGVRERAAMGSVTLDANSVTYVDGALPSLSLRSPERWWPTDQGLYDRSLYVCIALNALLPPRVDRVADEKRLRREGTGNMKRTTYSRLSRDLRQYLF